MGAIFSCCCPPPLSTRSSAACSAVASVESSFAPPDWRNGLALEVSGRPSTPAPWRPRSDFPIDTRPPPPLAPQPPPPPFWHSEPGTLVRMWPRAPRSISDSETSQSVGSTAPTSYSTQFPPTPPPSLRNTRRKPMQ